MPNGLPTEAGPSSPAPPFLGTTQPGTSPRPAPAEGGGVRDQRGGQPTSSPDVREEAQFQNQQAASHEEALERARSLPVYGGQPQPLEEGRYGAIPQPGQLLGEAAYSPRWQTTPLITDGRETFAEVAATMSQIDAEDPILVMDLLRSGWAMMAMPEMIAFTRSQMGIDNGETLAMLETLIPDLPEYQQENIDQALADTPLVAQFFEETKHLWRSDEREYMMTVLASIPADGGHGYKPRETVVALARAWLYGNEGTGGGMFSFGGVEDALLSQMNNRLSQMDDPAMRQKFMGEWYQWARRQQQEYYGRAAGAGAVGAWLQTPANTISRGLNWLAYGMFGDPEEWQWRSGLSFGQNVATSMGYDPGDRWSWMLTSGTIDGFNQIFLDPLNLVAGWGLGRKLANSIALLPRLANIPRWQRVIQAAIPVLNRGVVRLPRFSRNLGARVAWSLMAKPEEWFVQTAAKNAVPQQIFDMLHGPGGIAEVLEHFPAWRPIADDFVRDILYVCPTPDDIAEALRLTAAGQLTLGEKGADGIRFLEHLRQVSGDVYKDQVRAGLAAGDVAPHSVNPKYDGFRPQAFGVMRHVGLGVPTGEMEPGRVRRIWQRLGAVFGTDADGAPIVLNSLDEVQDLTGTLIYNISREDGTLAQAGETILEHGHIAPERPTSFDGSQVVLTPGDWKPTAILGDGTAAQVGVSGTRRMQHLYDWLSTHPTYHQVPEASMRVSNASSFYVRASRRGAMVPLKQAMLTTFEGDQRKWVNAWWMRQNGITITDIARQLGVSARTAGRYIERGGQLAGEKGGIFNIVTGGRLIDLDETTMIRGTRYFKYQTEDGIEIWAKADQGVQRVGMAYDQMSPATRLHMLLRDLNALSDPANPRTSGVADAVGDILARIFGDEEVKGLLVRYAESLGFGVDELRLLTRALPGSEEVLDLRLVTAHGAKRLQRAKFITDSEGPANKYRAAFDTMRTREALEQRIRAGGTRTLWIKDFPIEMPKIGHLKQLWRAHASNDAKGWWGYMRRMVSSKFFNPRYRPLFKLENAGDAAHSVGVFLRKIGLPETFILKWVNELIHSSKGERIDVLRRCVQEASAEIGFPLFQFGLVEYVERQGIRTYAAIDTGGGIMEELGLAFSRSDRHHPVAVPWLTSHMSTYAQLPAEQFFRSLRRIRRTQRWRGHLPKRLLPAYERGLEGWIKPTRVRRARLAKEFENKLRESVRKGGMTQEKFDGFSQTDFLAMAYATVWRSKNDSGGLGAVAHTARVLGKMYNVFHGVFSVAQLALRPIAWAGRVLLEEQFRGSFFDLPSLARNPFRMMAAWTDTAMIGLTQRWQAKNRALVQTILTDMFKGAPADATPADLVDMARRVIPEIDRFLTGKNLSDATRVRTAVAHVISKSFVEESNASILKGSRFYTRRVARRTYWSHLSRERMQEMGLETDFTWSMSVPGIQNKAFARQYIDDVATSGSVPVQITAHGMTPEQGERYGVALGRSLHQLGNDPIISQYGLARILARYAHGSTDDTSAFGPIALTRTHWWDEIKGNVRRMAQYDMEERNPVTAARVYAGGLNDVLVNPTQASHAIDANILDDEIELARWFLETRVDRYTDYMFGWLFKNLPDEEAVRVLGGFVRKEKTTFKIGNGTYTLDFHSTHEHSFVNTIKQIVQEQSMSPDLHLPPTVTSHWEAKYLFEQTPDSLTGVVKHTARLIMATAGDTWSQRLNRRPAWLSSFRDHYRYYTERGFAPEAARQAAAHAATEIVNTVYYNMENAVPFLRAFNKVSPFFTAWWEVAQTWAYKIPAIYGWPIGIPMMVRKVDRFMGALIKCGIIEVDAEADPDSPIKTRQLRLRLDPHARTGNPFGDLVSKSMYHFLHTPVTIATHLTFMRNILGSAEDFNEGVQKDVWQLAVGNPVDFWSHGIMGVNQAYLGMNPAGTFVASKILNSMPFAVDYDQEEAVEGESMTQLAERWETSPSAIYNLNRQAFIDAFGEDTARQAFAGEISPEMLRLPAGVNLRIPGTSLMHQLIDPAFFPFGQEDSVAGIFFNILPGYVAHIFRGWGLWEGSSEGLAPDATMPDSGFLSIAANKPETRAGITGEIIIQMQHLEAEEQLMTRVIAAGNRVGELVLAHSTFLGLEELGGGLGFSITQNEGTPEAQEFLAAQEDQRVLESELLTRAMNNAGASGVVRGIAGFFAPAIPRMLFHEQEIAAAYHQARQYAEGSVNLEELVLPALRGGDEAAARDAQAFNDLLGAWLAEPERGSFAKHYLATNYPEILPFTLGKTYWGPNGESPDEQTMNDYSDDLRSGLRQPYPPIVLLQRYARSANSFSKEVEIVQAYGNDPVVAASRIVQNYAGYRDLIEPYNIFYNTMDWSDDFFWQGAFLEWQERNREDNATFVSELIREAEMDIDTLEQWSVNADEVLSMQPDERTEFIGNMRGIVSRLRDGIESWGERFGETEIESPRQAALAEYFTQVGNYYDGLATLYEQVDAATDSEARSRLFDQIRNQQNQTGMEPIYIQGVRFPSVLEWWWNSKTPEEKNTQMYRWVASKPEWLNVFACQRLTEAIPRAAAYLPTTAHDVDVYNEYNSMRSTLGDMFEPNSWAATFDPYTMGQQNQMFGNLQDALTQWLIAQGRQGEALYRNMVPIQRLDALGLLPATLRPYMGQVNMIIETLDANQKSPESEQGRQLFGFVWMTLQRDMNWNPQIGEDLAMLGEQMFDADAYDEIFPRLFQGAYAGEI